MSRPDWAPEGVNIEVPSSARVYDYLLGGSHNFAADRELANRTLLVMPDLALQSQANRAFLHRAVRYLVGEGVRQFIDIGSGVPTAGNVHEVAQQVAPDSRVVYVDFDAVAVAHGRAVLAGNDRTVVVQEDLRHPDAILGHPALRGLLDLDQPVAVLLVALLHAISDADDPYHLVATLCDGLAPGSFLVIAHGTADVRREDAERLVRISQRSNTPLTLRGRAEVERFFTGFPLVEPGLVWAPQWHPEHPDEVGDQPELSGNYVGVGRKG